EPGGTMITRPAEFMLKLSRPWVWFEGHLCLRKGGRGRHAGTVLQNQTLRPIDPSGRLPAYNQSTVTNAVRYVELCIYACASSRRVRKSAVGAVTRRSP